MRGFGTFMLISDKFLGGYFGKRAVLQIGFRSHLDIHYEPKSHGCVFRLFFHFVSKSTNISTSGDGLPKHNINNRVMSGVCPV